MRVLLLVLALATRVAAADKVNVTGKWDLTVETSAGSGNPTAEFKQEDEKLSGTYRGMFGESKLEGTVKGNKIEFKVPVNAQGNQVTFVYTGTIEEDGTMKGKVDLGGMGEGTWTAERAKEEKKSNE